ncbi:hypothetical protein GCM10009547_00260 [Sporichthya brevicatena]|uniref:DUF5135 domain-containing protein n=1 Tax=Sporichthya brevicatena TaxID=171442 RepID=A0ABN1G2M9_9ACTN
MAVLAEEVRPDVTRRPVPKPRLILGAAAAGALVLTILMTAKKGPEGRILADRPAETWPQLWGYDHWISTVQIATLIATTSFLAYFTVWSRRNARLHPAFPVLAGLFVMGAFADTFANWTSSAAMNPELLHYPTDWPILDVSPTTEPIINKVAYPYLFLFPALAVVTLLRRRARRTGRSPRRPLWTVFGITFVIAVLINWVLVNLFMCRIEYWTYTQIPDWAAVRGGTPWQYSWHDPLSLSFITAAAGVLLWISYSRDTRALKQFGVTVLVTAIAYLPYNAVWASFRLTDSGDTLAPWIYENTKVYDPKGDYAEAGVPGPYFKGIWP